MGKRRWKGRPRTVAWCAFKGCPVSLPVNQLFCPKHAREALALLGPHGVLRPRDEIVPVITTGDVIDAVRGPLCKRCKQTRTHNPSKECRACLGDRACPKCRGTGTDPRDPIASCPLCPGTGLRP